MKNLTLLKKTSFTLFFSFNILNFSFGQNATDGGTIGMVNPDTAYTATYFVGEVADTILNFSYPSGGDPQLDLQYHWDVQNLDSFWVSAPGNTNNEYYIPPTNIPGTFNYFRDARRQGFAVFQAVSNIVVIEVIPAPVSIETATPSVINIYPNPVTKYLQVEFKKDVSPNWQIDIFDLKGSLQKSIKLERVQNIQTLDLQNLASGIYLIQLTDLKNDKVESIKILKEK